MRTAERLLDGDVVLHRIGQLITRHVSEHAAIRRILTHRRNRRRNDRRRQWNISLKNHIRERKNRRAVGAPRKAVSEVVIGSEAATQLRSPLRQQIKGDSNAWRE